MCGIAGIININKPKALSESLVAMTNSIRKRGPDDEGFMLFNKKSEEFHGNDSRETRTKHINSSFDKQFSIGFGFRQLKIIDLSNKSHQPMSDEKQRFWVIFNGELYNYKEVRSELNSLGHSFFSDSDTEVLLKAYMQWGEKCLAKFNGMFAFAIFDTVKENLFIARDRIGIKPLYYVKTEDQFIFGSTIKSIIDSKLHKAEIDWEGLSQNYRFSIAQRPHTCFKNISALEPAHYIKYQFKTKEFRKVQYWQVPVGTQDFSLSEKKASELLEEALFKSVNYRLKADVEVGSFMSGGIDSTLISVIAAKADNNLKVLTLGFKEFEEYNEIVQATDTAKLHNLHHIIKYTHPNEILDNIDNAVAAYEEPYHHLSANLILSKMASDSSIKVVLNGLGGDELFGGYDVFKKLELWNKLKKNKALINLFPKVHTKIEKANSLANYSTQGQYYSHYYTTYSDKEINRLFSSDNFDTKDTLSNLYDKENLEFTDDFEAMSFYNLKSYIGNHHLRTLDQFTMHYSIEGRIPFLDHEFIGTAFKIPSKYKIKNGIQKYILRDVAKKYIAPSCLNMSKKGLRLPLEHWINTDLKEFVNDQLSSLKGRKIFNSNEIEALRKGGNEMKIWQLVSTELWINKFID